MLSAILSPISSTVTNSSNEAVNNASIDLKCRANFLATVSPTNRTPSANNTFSKGICLEASIPNTKFCADFSET